MLTAGIDLAAEPKGTALTLISWGESRATIELVRVNLTDQEIVELTKHADKVGIDCAFGWPKPFADFIESHSKLKAASVDGGMDARRNLAYRETDRQTREITGRWPLSVSTDRLGLTAIRCAALLESLRANGRNINRSGSEDVVEIYPGASLRIWKFETAEYRKSAQARARLLKDITRRAPWLDLGEFTETLADSCDAFDSLIAALSTRAVTLGFSTSPSDEALELAEVEGWIHLPTQDLSSLLLGAS